MPNNSGTKFTFKKGYNVFQNAPGWKPQEIPDFDPIHPSMVLHDILEHEPGAVVLPHEEFKALGAAFYIRHEGGYFNRKDRGKASDTLQGAMGMLYFHSLIQAKRQTKKAPQNLDATIPLKNTETELEMMTLITNSRKNMKGDYRFSKVQKQIDASLSWCLPWMRIGYRTAGYRFAKLNVKRLSNMYFNAEVQIDRALTNAYDNTVLSIRCIPEEYMVELEVSEIIKDR